MAIGFNNQRNMRQYHQSDDSDSDDDFGFGFGREMMNFGNHNHMMNFGNNDNMMSMNMINIGGGRGGVSHSTSTSYQTFIDKNGKKQVKKVQKTHNKNVDRNGNVIEDFEELYKDTKNGINRIQKGKRLNDKGMKVMRENIRGEMNEEKHFHNMDEDELDEFIKNYQNHPHSMMIKQDQR